MNLRANFSFTCWKWESNWESCYATNLYTKRANNSYSLYLQTFYSYFMNVFLHRKENKQKEKNKWTNEVLFNYKILKNMDVIQIIRRLSVVIYIYIYVHVYVDFPPFSRWCTINFCFCFYIIFIYTYPYNEPSSYLALDLRKGWYILFCKLELEELNILKKKRNKKKTWKRLCSIYIYIYSNLSLKWSLYIHV